MMRLAYKRENGKHGITLGDLKSLVTKADLLGFDDEAVLKIPRSKWNSIALVIMLEDPSWSLLPTKLAPPASKVNQESEPATPSPATYHPTGWLPSDVTSSSTSPMPPSERGH